MITTTSPAVGAPPRERAAPNQGLRTAASMLTLPWPRLALGLVLALAALLNCWALASEGYANSYYAAAVRSMLESWHNFFFVSFDPGGFVSIDKPPLGFWIETASAKLFGYSGVSLLLPEALAGVLAVAVLYRLVARAWGRGAGLLAALALAVTPVSVVTARNNTIDSLLVLTVLLGAWACLRAAATGKLRWLLLCAVLVGLGFNIKMLEAYLVVPAFGLVYLMGAPIRWPKRIAHLALAAVALLAVSLSWAVAVDLTPASLRPYVGSSGTNSELNLAFGYNGLQRLTGQLFGHGGGGGGAPAGGGASAGGGPGGPGGGNALFNGGPAGLFRLLGTTLGGQVSWLLVLAVLGLVVAATCVPWRRLDGRSRSLVLWGGWLVTAGAFFSVAEFFHPYYTVMLAPAIAALAAIGVTALWRAYRAGDWRGWLLPAVLLASAGTQASLLREYPAWSRWLTPVVVGACLLAALALTLARLRIRRMMRAPLIAGGIAVAALLAAPTTWAAYTVAHADAINATIPTAGPSAAGTGDGAGAGFGGPGGVSGRGFGPPNGSGVPSTGSSGNGASGSSGNGASSGPSTGSSASSGGPAGGTGTGSANGSPPSSANGGSSSSANGGSSSGASGGSSSSASGGAVGGGMPGAPGGPGGDRGSQANTALIKYLEAHQGTAKYLVATTSSQSAAPIIIATGKPVMALGGFSGSDQILTTAQLAALVKAGTVRYFLIQSGGPGMGSAPSGSASSGSGAAGSSSTAGTSGARNGAASTSSASGSTAPRAGGMPGGPGGNSALTQWVTAHCTVVPSSAYSTSSTTASGGFGQGGTLYVCNSTSTTSK